MIKKVQNLLKEKNPTFRSGDGAHYSANPKRGIWEAKAGYRRNLEGHLSSNHNKQVWQEVQHITGYRSSNL